MYGAADQWRYSLVFPVLGFFFACQFAIATATAKIATSTSIDGDGILIAADRKKMMRRDETTQQTATSQVPPVEELPATQTAMSILSKFRVCGHESLIRAGPRRDGGYVVPNWPATRPMGTMFSIGIRSDDPLSHDLSDKFGIKAHLYDCTSGPSPCPADLPRCNVTFHHMCAGGQDGVIPGDFKAWYKQAIGQQKLPDEQLKQQFQSIQSMVQQEAPGLSTDLILKIDCEGCEWDAFDTLPSSTLNRFSFILAEMHFLEKTAQHEKYLRIMTKLTQNFAIIHTHGCNCGKQLHFTTSNGTQFKIPDVVETTLVRKDLLTSPLDCSMEANYQADLDTPICRKRTELRDDTFKLP